MFCNLGHSTYIVTLFDQIHIKSYIYNTKYFLSCRDIYFLNSCPFSVQTESPPSTQWQLDRWLDKVPKKHQSNDHDPGGGQRRSVKSDSGRGPSPGRYWGRDSESRRDYSPCESPVPSPKFDYSPRNSPRPSPEYSPCPSPGISLVPSPVPSVCPSPGDSLRGSRSPSPLFPHPPRSPSPNFSSTAVPIQGTYPQVQSPQQESPRHIAHPTASNPAHRPKVRPWVPPDHSSNQRKEFRSKDSRHGPLQQPHHSKHSLTEKSHKDLTHKPESKNSESTSKQRFNSPSNPITKHSLKQRPRASPKPQARHSSTTDHSIEHNHRNNEPTGASNHSSTSKSGHSSYFNTLKNSDRGPSSKSRDSAQIEVNNQSSHSSKTKSFPDTKQSRSKQTTQPRSSPKPRVKLGDTPVPRTGHSKKRQSLERERGKWTAEVRPRE